MAESGWLRDRVKDEEISLLFTSQGADLKKAIAAVMDRASRSRAIERTLHELLELAVDEGIDDTSGAIWISLILVEIQSRDAIPTLLRSLAGDDEALAEAAVDALRRLGEPAFDAIMRALEGNENIPFELACCRTLEGAASWDHPYLLDEVREFLLERIGAPSRAAAAVEAAALSLARLGERRAIEPLREILASRFANGNPAIQDAVEMLEENEDGTPLGIEALSWEERVDWLADVPFARPEQIYDPDDDRRRRPSHPMSAEDAEG